jgi:hypothetical protein
MYRFRRDRIAREGRHGDAERKCESYMQKPKTARHDVPLVIPEMNSAIASLDAQLA